MCRLDPKRRQRAFGGVGTNAVVIDVPELHPLDLCAQGEPALRKLRQRHARLRGLVAVPRNGDGTVEQHRVAAEPLAIARSDGQPTSARHHVAEVPVEAVVEIALTEMAVGEERRPRDRIGLGEESLRLRVPIWHRQRFLWFLCRSAQRSGAQEDECQIRNDRGETRSIAEKAVLHAGGYCRLWANLDARPPWSRCATAGLTGQRTRLKPNSWWSEEAIPFHCSSRICAAIQAKVIPLPP